MRWRLFHPLVISAIAFAIALVSRAPAWAEGGDEQPAMEVESTLDSADEPANETGTNVAEPAPLKPEPASETRDVPSANADDVPAAAADPPIAATEPTDPYADKAAAPAEPPAPSSAPATPHAADLHPAKPPQAEPRRITLDPATLDGVQPGTTTREELHERWGKPEHSQRVAGGARETYRLDKLGRVRTTIVEDLVTSLTVQFERPAALAAVAQRLAINGIEPVDIFDERGELLGAAYPERGVLLGYVPASRPPQVFQVVVESIDAQPFLARAELRLHGRYAESLADVEQALELAPEHPQAFHLRGELLLKRGQIDEALKSAEHAAELEPAVAAHRLLVARILAAAGDYSQAIARVRDLLDEPALSDLDAAQAACQWGDYLAQSQSRDFAQAIKYHQQAIQLAEPLAADPERSTRRAAKDLLLAAHLGVAYDIGHGRWQQKTESVAKWIDRAAVLADDLMRTEQAGPETRLRVYTAALAAIGGIAEPPDVTKWVAGTRQLGQKLFEQAQDPTYRAELAWQLGRAMSDVVQIETTLSHSDEAFAAGSLARSLFEEAEPVAGKLPTYSYLRGLLYYRIGVTYAIERNDHTQAVIWFDRATPLLESPVPAAAVDAGTQGETFVSMAVSYWEQQSRQEALRLTSQGLKLMEQSVEDGALEAAALAVPYSNLAAMHEELGDQEQAKWCADLAQRYENSTKK